MPSTFKFCPTCKDVTGHNSVEKPGKAFLEWVCSVCGANNGAH